MHFTKSQSRTTKKKYPHFSVIEVKHKHPRQIVVTQEIQGKKGTLIIKSSMSSETHTQLIPEEANPILFYLIKSPIKLCYYKGTQRVFVYKLDGTYCGCLEKHDLKYLFFKIGALLRALKNKNG